MPAEYLNPVYVGPCADPFVLKHAGEYWCYCTRLNRDSLRFGVLHSKNLVEWLPFGGALTPLAPEALPYPDLYYWAPEVIYHHGRFVMYYSVGNETFMQIRAATASHPAGPFTDAGYRLTSEDFAIDPHVFVDDDGARYFFYATDFLNYSHIGTGTVRDRLLDDFTLAGDPQPVTRARYDWQVYDPQRAEKGGVRWHTVEGPCVLKHKGRYYQMFSGGNWQNPTYGVSYAVSPRVNAPGEWSQVADGERVLPVLRTLPAAGVIGPGHNSVVRGPDNRQLFCIYHRWQRLPDSGVNERVLAIDRLEWVGERLAVLGPTATPQPAPTPATLSGFSAPWLLSGEQWDTEEAGLWQNSTSGTARAELRALQPDFTLELTWCATGEALTPDSQLTLTLHQAESEILRFTVKAQARSVTITSGAGEHVQPLPADFDLAAWHGLCVEVNHRRVTVLMNDIAVRWQGALTAEPDSLVLQAQALRAGFAGFALTTGWEDSFFDADPPTTPDDLGWQRVAGAGVWVLAEAELRQTDGEATETIVVKGHPLSNYEWVVNARLQPGARGGYLFFPAWNDAHDPGPLLLLVEDAGQYGLRYHWEETRALASLPADFDPQLHQHFRFRKEGSRLAVLCGEQWLGDWPAPERPGRVGLGTRHASAAFDLSRVTALPPFHPPIAARGG